MVVSQPAVGWFGRRPLATKGAAVCCEAAQCNRIIVQYNWIINAKSFTSRGFIHVRVVFFSVDYRAFVAC
jgi:hypothetical protein